MSAAEASTQPPLKGRELILAVCGYVSSTPGHFVAKDQQPDAAVLGLILGFSVLPGLLTLASIPFLNRYKAIDDDLSAKVLV